MALRIWTLTCMRVPSVVSIRMAHSLLDITKMNKVETELFLKTTGNLSLEESERLSVLKLTGAVLPEISRSELMAGGLPLGSAVLIVSAIDKAKRILEKEEAEKKRILEKKKMTREVFVVYSKFELDSTVPTTLKVRFTNQDELDKWVKSVGGGTLSRVTPSDSVICSTLSLENLENGATYILEGGQQEAIRNHHTWTQVMDAALEREAASATLREAARCFGGGGFKEYQFAPGRARTLTNTSGVTREIDGLLFNEKTAIVIEAKHSAKPDHVGIVIEKTAFIRGLVEEGGISQLRGVTEFHGMILATNLLSDDMKARCKTAGLSVVFPTGDRLRFIFHSDL